MQIIWPQVAYLCCQVLVILWNPAPQIELCTDVVRITNFSYYYYVNNIIIIIIHTVHNISFHEC